MSDFLTYELFGWNGMDTMPDISDKDPHRLEDCQNVEFDEEGMILKRRGSQKIGVTFSGRTNFIYDFQSQQGFKDTEDKHRVVVIAGSVLYVMYDNNIVDALFPADAIIHYGVSSDNGIAYIANEADSRVPFMLCYIGTQP